jgi:hypothetical protein
MVDKWAELMCSNSVQSRGSTVDCLETVKAIPGRHQCPAHSHSDLHATTLGMASMCWNLCGCLAGNHLWLKMMCSGAAPKVWLYRWLMRWAWWFQARVLLWVDLWPGGLHHCIR